MVLKLGELVTVDLDLHGQHAYLLRIDLQLVWLAVEGQALDYVRSLSRLCPYESEFDVSI